MRKAADTVWSLWEQAVPAELCAELADRVEWEMVAAGNTTAYMEGVPSSVDIDDPSFVRSVWDHVQELVPPHFESCALVGPHPKARLLRYEASADFSAAPTVQPLHADTPLAMPGALSRLTALIYVSSKVSGGSVSFCGLAGEQGAPVEVQPLQGSVLVFDHRVRHCAAAVTCGTKRLIKLSILYALTPECAATSERVSVTEADRASRLPFFMAATSAARTSDAHSDFFARPPLCAQTLRFFGTKRDEFDALVKQAGLEEEPKALEAARERLLDFIVLYDLSCWPKDVVARAFMPMAMALNSQRLKIRAYKAFDAARQLHGDDRCILLAETLAKDLTDLDEQVRLVALSALGSTLTQTWGVQTRGEMFARTIILDPSLAVRLLALKGTMSLAEEIGRYDVDEARVTAAHDLLDACGNALQQMASVTPSTGNEVTLANQALARLRISASALTYGEYVAGTSGVQLAELSVTSLLD